MAFAIPKLQVGYPPLSSVTPDFYCSVQPSPSLLTLQFEILHKNSTRQNRYTGIYMSTLKPRRSIGVLWLVHNGTWKVTSMGLDPPEL